jgi:hypothetical protein
LEIAYLLRFWEMGYAYQMDGSTILLVQFRALLAQFGIVVYLGLREKYP